MNRRTAWLIGILGVALALRATAAVGLQVYLDRKDRSFLIEGDANGYWELGRKIAAGDDYALYDPPRYVLRMPGFPAVLALSGGSLLFARLILAGVGALACGLVFLLGRELAGERIGLIAAAIAAVSPPLVGFSAMILSETTFAAAMLGSLWLMARLWNRAEDPAGTSPAAVSTLRPAVCAAFLTGAAIAAAVYVRPSWLLFAPLFVAALCWKSRSLKRGGLLGGALFLGTAVAMTPWAIRNARVTDGRLVVTTLWAGPSLYDGLNPDATGDSDMTFFERDDLLQNLSEYEMDREYRRRAWAFAAENPGRVVELAVGKLGRYWKPWPNAPQFQRWWLSAPFAVFFLGVMPAAVCGAWIARRNPGLLLLAVGPILYFAAIHSLFVSSIRYRLPAEYALYVASAVGIAAWFGVRPTTGGVGSPDSAHPDSTQQDPNPSR